MNRDSLAYNKPINWFEAEGGSMQKAAPDRCGYCGVNMNSPCKSHSVACPNHCDFNAVPVGNEVTPLFLLILGYLVIKIVIKNVKSNELFKK